MEDLLKLLSADAAVGNPVADQTFTTAECHTTQASRAQLRTAREEFTYHFTFLDLGKLHEAENALRGCSIKQRCDDGRVFLGRGATTPIVECVAHPGVTHTQDNHLYVQVVAGFAEVWCAQEPKPTAPSYKVRITPHFTTFPEWAKWMRDNGTLHSSISFPKASEAYATTYSGGRWIRVRKDKWQDIRRPILQSLLKNVVITGKGRKLIQVLDHDLLPADKMPFEGEIKVPPNYPELEKYRNYLRQWPRSDGAVRERHLDSLQQVRPFIRHIGLMSGGDKEVAAFLLKWLALPMQRPGLQSPCAVCIQGVRGSGKSILGEILRHCVGHDYVGQLNCLNDLKQRSAESQLIGKLFTVADEVSGAKREHIKAFTALNSIVTSYIQTHDVKNRKTRAEPVFTHLLVLNSADTPLHLVDDNRQWLYSRSNATAEDGRALAEWAEKNYGEIKGYLKGLPIEEGFQDKHPTVTQDKPDLLEGSKAIEDDIGSQVAEAFSAEAVAMANCQPLALPSGLHVIKTGEGMEIMAKYEYVRGRMKDFAKTDFQPNYVYKLEKFGWKRISSRKSPWGTKVRVWFLATQAEDE